ncbi:EamA domain-containing membrane protein RarD [Lutibacter sp. Hel_I_33_5]|uniref:DMT family transporter n=1 Tax=Lutibacter sp. Hel_I_33_5 TaxID=1566289 RepID=UPI0011A4365C|nr:DMT family transporter [Lutibacter sp. Hel_I_33_5]TVZ55085.1 EamA domain-containing membrane protein RarD [Lutibacter sp. Hel_I_33_5]
MKVSNIFASGVFIGLLGVILFSAKAVMVKLAYQYNVTTLHLLLFRMLFAFPFYVLIAYFYRNKKQKGVVKKDYLWIIFFGFIGYYLAAYFDFLGLQYVKAGYERIILFVFPTLVIIISRIFFKTKVTSNQVIAIIITYIGIIITFWGEIDTSGNHIVLGTFLIFMSALTYATYLVGSDWLIPKFGVLLFTSYAMITSTICICIHYLLLDRASVFDYPKEVYFFGFLMATVSTLIPSFLVSWAIKKMNASNFSIIGSFGPISTIILAYFFLDERLSLIQVLGSTIVILGIIIVSKNKSK